MRIIIVDPGLKDHRGHHLALAEDLLGDARSSDFQAVVWSGDAWDAPQIKGCAVEPIFPVGSIYEPPSNSDPLGRLKDHSEVSGRIAIALGKQPVSNDDILIFHTATARVCWGLILWLNSMPASNRPTVVANLMMEPGLTFDPDTQTERVYDTIGVLQFQQIAESSTDLGSLFWVASSWSHAGEYQQIMKRPVRWWPLPFFEPNPNLVQKDNSVLLFAGDARPDKGFHLLPDVVQHLDKGIEGKILKVHATLDRDNAAIMETWRSLSECKLMRNELRLIADFLDEETFGALLASSDVAVFPYNSLSYTGKSSGLLWSAMALGIQAVVPNDCWLNGELDRWSYPYHAFASRGDQAKEISDAVQKAIADKPDTSAAMAAFNEATKRHRTLDALLSVTRANPDLPLPRLYPVFEINRLYQTRVNGSGLVFLKEGWHQGEQSHTWSMLAGAQLAFHITASSRHAESVLELMIIGQTSGELRIKNTLSPDISIEIVEGQQTIRVQIPEAWIGHDVLLDLDTLSDHTLQNLEDPDQRGLGFALLALRVKAGAQPKNVRQPSIYLWPKPDLPGSLATVRQKVKWYLSPFENRIKQVRFLDQETPLREGDQILILDSQPLPQSLPPGIKVVDVDAAKNRFEGAAWLHAGSELIEDHSSALEMSTSRLRGFLEKNSGRPVLLLGTGPSIEALEPSYYQSVTVIGCNSIVKNKDLMTRAKPAAVVFTDPIFHAGWSPYASAFRSELVDRFREHAFYLICNMRDFHIFRHHLPGSMEPWLIGLPQVDAEMVNLDLGTQNWVRSTNNVLTLAMLPVARSLDQDIRVAGFDGRAASENSYFWSHGTSVQFNDELLDIRARHPAFFDQDYDDYYSQFIDDCSDMMDLIEQSGAQIRAETPSHNPAMIARGAVPLSVPDEQSNSGAARGLRNPGSAPSESVHCHTWHDLSDGRSRLILHDVSFSGRYWKRIGVNLHRDSAVPFWSIWGADCLPNLFDIWPKDLPRHHRYGPHLVIRPGKEGSFEVPDNLPDWGVALVNWLIKEAEYALKMRGAS